MRYLCTSCNYIYDESIWDKEEGVKSGTKFENLWDNFCCPVCGELSEEFHEITEEINYIDENNLLWMEMEHFINIEIKSWNLEVKIGKWDFHPSWEEHRISQISLYDEYWDFVEERFFVSGQEAFAEFDISDLDDLEIRIRCTLHWVWGRKFER
jgi:rubredoxin